MDSTAQAMTIHFLGASAAHEVELGITPEATEERLISSMQKDEYDSNVGMQAPGRMICSKR